MPRASERLSDTTVVGFFVGWLINRDFTCFIDRFQQMVHWWFGFLGVPSSNNPFHKGIPGIQTTRKTMYVTLSIHTWVGFPIGIPLQAISMLPMKEGNILCWGEESVKISKSSLSHKMEQFSQSFEFFR